MDITADWKLYEDGKDYNRSIGYNVTVNRNWRFYNLQHWDHVNTKGLPKVKVPMSQQITNRSVAACMTKAVKMNYILENVADDTQDEGEIAQRTAAEWLSINSKDKWEHLKMDSLIRSILLDGANSGDFAAHTYWDATYDTGQTSGEQPVKDKNGDSVLDEAGNPTYEPVPILGDFVTEAVDGINVFLGNPNDPRINFNGRPFQPYVIIAGREVVSKLRKEAKLYHKENELTDQQIKDLIVADSDTEDQAGDRGRKELDNDEYGKATYIIKYWEDDGKIKFNKSVAGCFIRKDVDTELTLYPVAWGNWGIIKNSYHGQALMSGLVENQLELDKGWAAIFKYLKDFAFPKAVANKSYFPNGVTNKIGDVIYYDGDQNVKPSDVLSFTTPGQIANNVIECLQIFQRITMELLGTSDAVLGSANPENTSALIALTQNSTVPLENVKANVYQFVEDLGYIWLDFMCHKYKVPRKIAIDVDGVRQMVLFDPSTLNKAKFRIKIDVISGSYTDEFAATKAIENLFMQQQIDVVQFIERLPDGAIPQKEKLLGELKAKIKRMEEMQTEEFKLKAVQEFIQQQQATAM